LRKKYGLVIAKTATIAMQATMNQRRSGRLSHGVSASRHARTAAMKSTGTIARPAVYLKPIASPTAPPASAYCQSLPSS
jgi:hypothetical protein